MGAGTPCLYIEGKVDKIIGALEVRRDKQKGYLKGKKTSDINAKYTAITVTITSTSSDGKKITNPTSTTFQKFIDQLSGDKSKSSSLIIPRANVVMFWGKETLLADLASKFTEFGEPLLPGDTVSISTEGMTPVIRTIDVTERVKREVGKQGTMKGYTHMYGVVQGGPVKVDGASGLTDAIFKARKSLHEGVVGVSSTGATAATSSIITAKAKNDDDVKDEEWD